MVGSRDAIRFRQELLCSGSQKIGTPFFAIIFVDLERDPVDRINRDRLYFLI